MGTQTKSDDFFVEQNFLNDDKKVHYYTGLSNAKILVATFKFVTKLTAFGERRAWLLLEIILNCPLETAFEFGLSGFSFQNERL